MLLTLPGVLSPEALQEADALIGTLRWEDGARTAGQTARAVKRNQQADLSSRTGVKLRELLTHAVTGHEVLRAASLPRRISPLIVSRTGEGGGYGLHMDNAIMAGGDIRLRTDLSFTLFLSAPETYEGGELQVEFAGESRRFKLAAGDLVLYPATTLHQVRPVTGGMRVVCVGWIQSLVRDAAAREVLFDLENLKASLAPQFGPQSPEQLILSKALSNLLRLWAET